MKIRCTAATMSAVLILLFCLSPCFVFASKMLQEQQNVETSDGVRNIVKRAYQMTEILWTPLKDVSGWNNEITYYSGTTYKGLPYGQPVTTGGHDGDYVPWETGVSEFCSYVKDPDSFMYTRQATYNKVAPYYSTDCSAFVSWAWGLSSRHTTRSIPNAATLISSTSYEQMEVGDCLNKSGSHVVLVTALRYNSMGQISAVEISESTVNYATNYCCQRTWYGEGNSQSMDDFYNKYFGNGYILYRSNTRENVTYTHCCDVPLEGDTCTLCNDRNTGENQEDVYFGIDVSHHQGTIDWDVVAPQIDFAILRCGYGDNLTNQDDRKWENNAEACTRLGIPFGVYIYSYALTDEQAISEAEHVLRLINGYNPTLPIYLDLEDETILQNCSQDDILRHAILFCNRIKEAGYTPGIYANYNWWTNYLTAVDYDGWVRWIARYASSTGYTKEYSMWQYTSSGSVSGISGNVDLNYWYGPLPTNKHEHSFTSYISQDPTCTDMGENVFTCNACGYFYTESIAPFGHNYERAVTAPTCTSEGYCQNACTRCGDSFLSDFTAPVGHKYENNVCLWCGAAEFELVLGDVNLNGQVTSADAVLLARVLVDLVELNDQQKICADVNDDGVISSADAVMLSKFLVD